MPSSRKSTDASRLVSVDKNQRSIKQLVDDAVNSWKKEYTIEINGLKAELAEVRSSQEFISAKYDELMKNYDQLAETNRSQETIISQLKNQSTELKTNGAKEASKLDSLDQYGRRQNLEIVGIPITKGENTNAIVTEVAELLQVKIAPGDISTSHRLQSKNDKPPSIIVRFVNRDVRNNFYKNRKAAQNVDLSKLSVKGVNHIYVNENLTNFRKRLFWKTKQKAKEAGFKFFWTANGNILARKSEDTDPIPINSEKDLDLINQAN